MPLIDAKNDVDCDEEPSKKRISLLASFLKSLGTRTVKKDDL